MLLMLIAIIVMLCNKEHRCSPPVTHPRNGLGGQKDPAPEWRSSQPDLSNHHNIPTGTTTTMWWQSRFQKIWSRKKALISENLVSKKKSRFRFLKAWSQKRKNQNNKKETRPSKQCKSLIWIVIFFLFYSYLLDGGKQRLIHWQWRPIPEERKKKENVWRRRISFFWRRRKTEKYLEKNSPKIIKDIEKSRFRS